MTKKVAVIGAGILGINTAYFLAKKGMHVSVYDSNRYAGMETSYSNGAQISVCNSETWTQWENVSKGIQWSLKMMHHCYLTQFQICLIQRELIANTCGS